MVRFLALALCLFAFANVYATEEEELNEAAAASVVAYTAAENKVLEASQKLSELEDEIGEATGIRFACIDMLVQQNRSNEEIEDILDAADDERQEAMNFAGSAQLDIENYTP